MADQILEHIANGMSEREMVQIKGIPSRTVIRKWRDENAEFDAQYARAREIRADLYANDVIDIADDDDIDPQRARNQIDARKWAAGKMAPKTYGDRTIVQGTGDKDDAIHIDNSAGLEQIFSRIARLAAREDTD